MEKSAAELKQYMKQYNEVVFLNHVIHFTPPELDRTQDDKYTLMEYMSSDRIKKTKPLCWNRASACGYYGFVFKTERKNLITQDSLASDFDRKRINTFFSLYLFQSPF